MLGGILIAAGVLWTGISLLVLAGRFVSGSQTAEPVTLYLLLSAALITLGIGSMRGRRWAWALTIVGSASGVVFGLLMAPFLVWMVWQFLSAEPALSGHGHGHSFGWVVLAPLLFILGVMILVPVAFLLFYARRDVRATVERLDPSPGWTDRRPLPVLAAAVLFASTGLGWLAALWTPVIPLPGAILTGSNARAVVLTIALGCIAIGWGLYRGLSGAWLAAVAVSIAGSFIWLWALRELDLPAFQRAMGATEEELAVMRRIDLLPGIMTLTAVAAAAWTGFLFWVRKFLARTSPVSR